jgi:hypothetical protein
MLSEMSKKTKKNDSLANIGYLTSDNDENVSEKVEELIDTLSGMLFCIFCLLGAS